MTTEESKAANVVEALSRVMRDLPAIGKDQKAADAQGGYAYRGIEQITKEAQGLCAKHGVVFTPRVVGTPVVVDITVNNKPWTDTRMLVEYDVRGPGGPDDRIVVGPIFALGRDNSDKGANKCMTQAFKYALLQTFMVADSKDDADGTTHEADAGRAPLPPINPDQADALRARMEALPADQLDALKAEWVASGFVKVDNLPVDRLEAASALVARYEQSGTGTPEAAPDAPDGNVGDVAATPEPGADGWGPYEGLTKEVLVDVCRLRELAISGEKSVLRKRLVDNDAVGGYIGCTVDGCPLAASMKATEWDNLPYCHEHEPL